MDDDEAWAHVADQRRRLADLLEGLIPEQWETQSLASRWRVRDVAAHLTMVADPPGAGFILARAIEARGNFHVMNEVAARHHAARPTTEIVADLRDHADSRRVPVVTNPANVFFDLLVHVQDIARPLGVDWPTDVAAARRGADRVWAMGWPFHARRLARGLLLVATDDDWAVGEAAAGGEVRGPLGAHLLALTGRPAAMRDLEGSGAAELARRLAPRAARPAR
jgi:uncharacterized protein (TIGR03083 family)